MRKVLQGAAGTGVVIAVILFLTWPTLIGFGIRRDLHDYGLTIRNCTCSLNEKERLLDLVDELDDGVSQGEQVPTLFWLGENENIRSLLQGGLTPDKWRLVERELLKVRRKLSAER